MIYWQEKVTGEHFGMKFVVFYSESGEKEGW